MNENLYDIQGDIYAERDAKTEAAVEAMREDVGQVEEFFCDTGYSIAGLMVILSSGFPSATRGTEYADREHDRATARLDAYNEAFATWATRPRNSGKTPAQMYQDNHAADWAEAA